MAKINPEIKAQIKEAARHPVTWWKGADLPEETIRPWEGGIQFFAEALKGFFQGFESMCNRFYVGLGEGKVPPLYNSVSEVVRVTWDAINDPIIGLHMDSKRYSSTIHRWVMRGNATLSPLLILFRCFHFGLSPVQRVVQWMIFNVVADFISTANAVSEAKIWAGITPYSEKRGQLRMFKGIGKTVGALFTGIPVLLQGFREVLGITDYQIMVYGALIFVPLAIFCRWLPTFAMQRIDYTVKVNAEGEEVPEEEKEPREEKISIWKSLSIVKHNRWFIIWTIVWFLRVFIPGTNKMYLYRFLIPMIERNGKRYGGEILFTAKNILFTWPGFFLAPFAMRAVKLFRGPVNMIRADIVVIIFTHLTSYFVGYKSLPRLAYLWTMEGFRHIFENWRDVPHNIVQNQMYDYVEWKTGYRSEGLQAAVDGMFNKIVKNNLGAVIGGVVEQWTQYQGWDIPVEKQQPRFLNTIWPLMHLGAVAGEILTLGFILWFRYPHDPVEVEADLIERRALAQQMKEEMTVEEEA